MTQREFLKNVVNVLEQMEVTYLIVGSYASSVMGEPRMTVDVDIVVKLIREARTRTGLSDA